MRSFDGLLFVPLQIMFGRIRCFIGTLGRVGGIFSKDTDSVVVANLWHAKSDSFIYIKNKNGNREIIITRNLNNLSLLF